MPAHCRNDGDCPPGDMCEARRCIAKHCASTKDCAADFECMEGACARSPCTKDRDCVGWCVVGYCYDKPGTCLAIPS